MQANSYSNKIGFDRLLMDLNPDNNGSVVDDYNSINSLVER
jgi:hypothetical protein